MSAKNDVLFQPFKIKSLELKNRIVMAPMTRLFAKGGIPSEDIIQYYQRRAEGGVGLILSEGTVINRPASANHPDIPHFYGGRALAGWQQVIDSVHQSGGKMGPQIWHVGALPYLDSEWFSATAESPSGLQTEGVSRGKAMSEEDIADTIESFARAASDAKRLGFDTVEMHGAHGYLIDQFFWQATNHRTDKYGGVSLKERARFAADMIKSVRKAVGPEFPLVIRLSQWKSQDFTARLATSPGEMESWLVPLVEAGADVLHCSQRRFWQAEYSENDGEQGLNFAGWAKKLTGAITISVGSVGLSSDFMESFSGSHATPSDINHLLQRMEREEFDLIAVGRALLADPAWVNKVKSGDFAVMKPFDQSLLGHLS